MRVPHDYVGSDHLPLKCSVCVRCLPTTKPDTAAAKIRINWDKLSESELDMYVCDSDITGTLKHCGHGLEYVNAHHSYKHIPGWNDHAKDLHKQARDAYTCYQLWKDNSRQRDGPLFVDMQQTRARFKYEKMCVPSHNTLQRVHRK
jgi:hypothetical protein